MFGADDWVGEVSCAAQKESKEMPENVALQMPFLAKGLKCLNYEVQCVIDLCLKA